MQSIAAPAAAAVVVGFDPVGGLWVAKANAQTITIPGLDGHLLLDLPSRQAVATDWGKAISQTPKAVLKPGSVTDIVKMVQFCKRFELPVAGRGQGHTAYGQSQVAGGVVIDMTTLKTIYSIQPGRVSVAEGRSGAIC